MVITHFDDLLGYGNVLGQSKAIEWENVLARAQSVGMTVIYIVLLGTALFHGLYGFRTILFELKIGPGTRKFINVFFWLIGLGMFAFGTWAAVAAMALNGAA